jgi:regulator of nucleoside diphosphate kinase
MHGSFDQHLIVSELDFARLTRLLEQHDPATHSLDTELDRALLVRPSEIPTNVVTMNSEVVYEELETRTRRTVRIVYPRDADAMRGWISVLAPIGSALLGLRVGQAIFWPLPAGTRRSRVVEIRYQPEAAGDFHL